jgi:hypothetical protein
MRSWSGIFRSMTGITFWILRAATAVFLRGKKAIGADIDETAVCIAREKCPDYGYFCQNSLQNVSRSRYGLNGADKIIIVGNPPYNDTTSLIQNGVKKNRFGRDGDIITRDIGISFLLSYDKLQADYICVLHPLSYLIKKANFAGLGDFRKNYRLADSLVVSSGAFCDTSKSTRFPIIAALYTRHPSGMRYEYIRAYRFKTSGGELFSLDEYDTIDNYVDKYPNHNKVGIAETVAHFYTMRDINALKRTKTFIDTENKQTVRVTKEKFFYYCYVDVFKDYIRHIPYYFGNNNVMIDHEACAALEDAFIHESIKKHPSLERAVRQKHRGDPAKIGAYFKRLLGVHYVE